MITAVVFVFVAAALCAAAVLALFGVAHLYLSSSQGIAGDGLVRGTPAPAWSLTDSSGNVIRSTPEKPFQLIVFADHSLKSFPSVVDGLRDLMRSAPQLEIVILTRGPNDVAAPMLNLLGLGDIPVLTGSPALYARYNVRIMPFVIFMDSAGRVRASSLVNHAWQLERLWRLANLALEPIELPVTKGRRRRVAVTGV